MTWLWQKSATANDCVNLVVATGSAAVFALKEMWKQLGWVVKASSDGTTFNASGDQVTTGVSGAGGMANNSAWFRLQDPAGVREFTWQRGTTNLVWRIKWSHSAKFTGGSPAATVTPSATDEQVDSGGGTDASPTFATVWGADGTLRLHAGGDNAVPFPWWYRTTAIAGGATSTVAQYLDMQRGSYPAADVAPYTIKFNAGAMTISTTVGVALGSGYYKKGLAGEAFVSFNSGVLVGFSQGTANAIAPASSAVNSFAVNPYTGNDGGLPVPVGRGNNVSTPGWKGFVAMTTMKFPSTFRNQFDFEDETATAWVASTPYPIADTLVSNGGNVYRCVTTGTSAASGGPTGTGNAIADNTVVWAFLTPVARYTLIDAVLLRSPPGVVLS